MSANGIFVQGVDEEDNERFDENREDRFFDCQKVVDDNVLNHLCSQNVWMQSQEHIGWEALADLIRMTPALRDLVYAHLDHFPLVCCPHCKFMLPTVACMFMLWISLY